MTTSVLHYEIKDNIARLILDHANTRNALSRPFWDDMKTVMAEIAQSNEARVVVLQAKGPHFSSGINLEMLYGFFKERPDIEIGRRRDIFRRMVLDLQESITVLETCDVPVIAAIQGACIGGALELVCAADFRIATKNAFFSVKETEFGFPADLGALQRLPRLIPPGLARELAYTSRKFKADEALQHGFVNSLHDDNDALDQAVDALAKTIAARSPMAIQGTKEAFRYSANHSVEDSLRQMAVWQSGMAITDDVNTAIEAMEAKKPPLYRDYPKTTPLYYEEVK